MRSYWGLFSEGNAEDKLYVHKPKVSSSSAHKARSSKPVEPSHSSSSSSSSSKPVLVKKPGDKKKSNLEIFKEELRQIQEEREERRKLKDQISTLETKLGTSVKLPPSSAYSMFLDDDDRVFDGTYDLSGDSTSTNLYMGNIATDITEDQICQVHVDRSFDWWSYSIHQPSDLSIDWLIDWLTDWSLDWFIHGSIVKLIDWLLGSS